jgi:DNA gyrase subunit A
MKNKNLSLIRKKDIISEVKKRFLNYAIYTLEDRAIPNLYDGLKPVHRRILFAMYELKLFNNFKKSAKTVGDVIGKYHPHGDQAVYKSMVKMGQIFYSRYPLIDTQGNFGSIDGDEPAAMRYTEAKLSKISVELMKYLDKETVSYESNYDNSEKEPSVLPSLFPNLLVNGSIGIAVGFSTRIPSHNLNEIISSLIALTENEDLTIDELLKKYIKGPDFPTGGYIFLNDDLKKAYLTGHGSVTIRGKAIFEKLDSKRKAIVITEIPYQLKKSDLVLEIAYLIEQKKIQDVHELRDESNYKGIRIVLELKRENSEKNILYKLFK